MKTRVAGLTATFLLVLLVSAVVLVASASHSAAGGVPVKVGLVTDEGTLADKGYNWLSYQGLLRAESELGVVGAVYTSPVSADYGPNLQQCADDGNSLCISVGFFTAQAIATAAEANPGTSFAIVDSVFEDYPSNLRGMGFAPEGAGYLAGTLAGLMTESGVIGGVGGMRLPSVEGHLEPYRDGAGCANAAVTVLVTYTGTFIDPDLGAVVAQDMMSAEADVIFTVGGPTGNGALMETTQAGGWGIGVDTDQYVTHFGGGIVPGADKVLSSAIKKLDIAVYDTISDTVHGAFTSGTVVYDLAADGVGLAPFHEADPHVPQSVRDKLAAVKRGIIDGSIDVNKSCYYVHLPLVNRNR